MKLCRTYVVIEVQGAPFSQITLFVANPQKHMWRRTEFLEVNSLNMAVIPGMHCYDTEKVRCGESFRVDCLGFKVSFLYSVKIFGCAGTIISGMYAL